MHSFPRIKIVRHHHCNLVSPGKNLKIWILSKLKALNFFASFFNWIHCQSLTTCSFARLVRLLARLQNFSNVNENLLTHSFSSSSNRIIKFVADKKQLSAYLSDAVKCQISLPSWLDLVLCYVGFDKVCGKSCKCLLIVMPKVSYWLQTVWEKKQEEAGFGPY